MFKKCLCVIVIICVLFCSCSCLGGESPDKFGYCLTIGIDSGKAYKYNVSFLLESPEAEEKTASDAKLNIVSAEGDNIYEAIYISESALPYRLNFSRTNYIVASTECARCGKLAEFFTVSWGNLKIRTSANMVISQGSAYDFMTGLEYTSDINITKLEASLADFYEAEGLTSMISLTEFMTAISSRRFDATVPLGACDTSASQKNGKSDTTGGIYRTGGMVSYVLGTAVFSGDRLCGVLSGEETQMLLLLRGELENAYLDFSRTDGSTYSVRIGNSKKVKTNVYITDENMQVDIKISIYVTLEQDSSATAVKRMKKSGKIDDNMKKQLQDRITKACSELYRNLQSLDCDAVGIGKFAAEKFHSSKEWENFDLPAFYRNSTFSCSLDITVQNINVTSFLE